MINSPQPLLTFRVSVKKSAIFLPEVTFRSELAFLTAFNNLSSLFAVAFFKLRHAHPCLGLQTILYPHLSLAMGNVLLYFTEYIFHSFNIDFNASSPTPKLCLLITPQRSCLFIFFLLTVWVLLFIKLAFEFWPLCHMICLIWWVWLPTEFYFNLTYWAFHFEDLFDSFSK